MIIWIHKKHIGVTVMFLLFIAGMASILWSGNQQTKVAFSPKQIPDSPVLILDAGHGGEDGGAVSGDGTPESQINLAITQKLQAILQFTGQKTRMIRNKDVSIYEAGAVTLHEKKVSDLRERVKVVRKTPNSFLISIHQNSLPQNPEVHGAQAFYGSVEGSKPVALAVQEVLNEAVNQNHPKSAKTVRKGLYLFSHIDSPSVLIECGFLSNTQETQQLKTPSYQLRLAITVASGILQDTEEEPT